MAQRAKYEQKNDHFGTLIQLFIFCHRLNKMCVCVCVFVCLCVCVCVYKRRFLYKYFDFNNSIINYQINKSIIFKSVKQS